MADYIERELLIQRIKQEPTDGMYTDEILVAIGEIPTADVVPVVHGHWYQNEDTGACLAACSNCNESYDLCEGSLAEFAEFYCFCPACGARMDGGING